MSKIASNAGMFCGSLSSGGGIPECRFCRFFLSLLLLSFFVLNVAPFVVVFSSEDDDDDSVLLLLLLLVSLEESESELESPPDVDVASSSPSFCFGKKFSNPLGILAISHVGSNADKSSYGDGDGDCC